MPEGALKMEKKIMHRRERREDFDPLLYSLLLQLDELRHILDLVLCRNDPDLEQLTVRAIQNTCKSLDLYVTGSG